ncbi:AraC family transcriptional regulator [Paenibacillus mesophilus]|uniref:AraC family transcriptional regulator n=1 Tax=Paenibacillus mesophilus TaxID=2582849 RepID=UPI00110EAD46|nr:AraC family transcriptional regulator [Paenibacillus mesophilus]TMV47002.1 AraC family transcriptional regulator [Paenibacillus mesophilus]
MREYTSEYADYWFNVPTGFEKSGGIWLVRAGINTAKANYEAGPKQIDCFGLHFMIDGCAELEYDGQSIRMNKGDLFCLFPHMTYKYRTVPAAQTPLRMLWLTMDGPQTRALLEMSGITQERPYRLKAISRSVRDALKQAEEYIRDKRAGRLKLTAFILQLFAMLELTASNGSKETYIGYSAEGEWIDWAVRYLRLHYTEPLRIEQLAQLVGVHRTHFSQAFAKKYGLAPQQFLLRLRIDRAKELLRDTGLSVGEIALSIGYPDLYAFSRAFKTHTGQSPSEYRDG